MYHLKKTHQNQTITTSLPRWFIQSVEFMVLVSFLLGSLKSARRVESALISAFWTMLSTYCHELLAELHVSENCVSLKCFALDIVNSFTDLIPYPCAPPPFELETQSSLEWPVFSQREGTCKQEERYSSQKLKITLVKGNQDSGYKSTSWLFSDQ